MSNGESVTFKLEITTPPYFTKMGIENSWDQRNGAKYKEVMWYYAYYELPAAGVSV